MRGFWPSIALMTLSTVAGAQTSRSVRDLSTVTCKEIMGADDRERELSMAYMHGYINGKANRTTLDLDKNAAITDKVREYCLSNPTAKFAKTFENLSK
jgi:hypothetical protein